MEIKLDFGKSIETMVSRLYEIEKNADKLLEDIVRQIVRKFKAEAVKRVPIDTGDLEKSFSEKIIRSLSGDEIIGIVYIASNAPASEYALWMHEWDYDLGSASKQKQLVSEPGIEVGNKYLERALHDNEKEFGLFIQRKLRSFLK